MYRTVPATSPWLKMDSPRRYSVTLLETPAVSRKACGSKELVFLDLKFLIFIGARRGNLSGTAQRTNYNTKSSAAKVFKSEQHTHGVAGFYSAVEAQFVGAFPPAVSANAALE